MGSPILIRRVWDRCNGIFLLVLFEYEGVIRVSAETLPALLRVTPNRPCWPLISSGVTQTWQQSHALLITGSGLGSPAVPGVCDTV